MKMRQEIELKPYLSRRTKKMGLVNPASLGLLSYRAYYHCADLQLWSEILDLDMCAHGEPHQGCEKGFLPN